MTTPLRFLPGARDALLSLKRAGHVLVLWSGRAANRSLLYNPELCPLVRAGLRQPPKDWMRSRDVNEARRQQMLAFVAGELPGVFDVIDDGACGKISADLFIDDRALRMTSDGWGQVARTYGAK